jgi:hypothetical protein
MSAATLRIPSDAESELVNFEEACNLVCMLKPTLNILVIAGALKKAINEKTLRVELMPAWGVRLGQKII